MADIREYTRNVVKQNDDILTRIRKIQEDIASLANDIESNALAIEEIGEIIGGGD